MKILTETLFDPDKILADLDVRSVQIVEQCTACGDCVRVCPTPAHSGTDVSDPQAVAAGQVCFLSTPDHVRESKPVGFPHRLFLWQFSVGVERDECDGSNDGG